MPIPIKTAGEIAEKWARRTPLATPDYEAGIRAPRKDWETKTAAAESNYEGGVQAAIARKAFGSGVRRAKTAKWQSKAIAKGIPRWGPGVQVAAPEYEDGFKPYRDAIAAVDPGPRYAKRDRRNRDRINRVLDAIIAVKEKK